MNTERMVKKVIVISKDDIVSYPPVVSLCNILLDLYITPVLVAPCSDKSLSDRLEKSGVVLYKQPVYKGNRLSKMFQLFLLKKRSGEILKKEYIEGDTYVWVVQYELLAVLSSFISRYDIVAYMLEFRPHKLEWYYKLLFSPVGSFFEKFIKVKKVVCCEYNRAIITQYLFGLNKRPYVLPNKPYVEERKGEMIALPDDAKKILSLYSDKKIILYQGFIGPDRKLEDFIKAVKSLPEEYVLFIMGADNEYRKSLECKYAGNKVVFMPFIVPPAHMEVTKKAYIGILTYTPSSGDIGSVLNNLYCAPNKLYEYSRYGKPMISNDTPALRYAFSQYEAGICVEELNQDNILKAILDIDAGYENYSNQSSFLYDDVNMLDIVSNICQK